MTLKRLISVAIVALLISFIIISCKKAEEPVVKKNPTITWNNPINITEGTLLSATQLNAMADISGTFVYTPAIGTKLNIGTNQDLKVDFTPNDQANYNSVSKTVKINVNAKKIPIITWANPSDIIYETLLSAKQLNATADIPGTFVYTPEIGTKLNLGADQDLKVDFTPTDVVNYSGVSKTVKINIQAVILFNPNLTHGTMSDQDGNVYKTVTIGTQTWMAENLRTSKYRNGTTIPNISDSLAWVALSTGAYCTYENTSDNIRIEIYGRLYNWYAATDSRNIAPAGWHVPTNAEWTVLANYVGSIGVPGPEGGKMKETGTTHWKTPNSGATNESGFTALPSGNRGINNNGSIFYNVNVFSVFWSSTTYDLTNARNWYMYYNDAIVYTNIGYKSNGFSVRLIKD